MYIKKLNIGSVNLFKIRHYQWCSLWFLFIIIKALDRSGQIEYWNSKFKEENYSIRRSVKLLILRSKIQNLKTKCWTNDIKRPSQKCLDGLVKRKLYNGNNWKANKGNRRNKGSKQLISIVTNKWHRCHWEMWVGLNYILSTKDDTCYLQNVFE